MGEGTVGYIEPLCTIFATCYVSVTIKNRSFFKLQKHEQGLYFIKHFLHVYFDDCIIILLLINIIDAKDLLL